MERDQHTVATWERKRGAHLSRAERGAIQSPSGLGLSLRQIALQIECSPSTVMYELRRGTPRKTGTRGRRPKYRATLGQKTYEAHRKRCRKRPGVSKCGRFLEWLTGQVRRHKWSFDACVGHARRSGLFPDERNPCAKTLYNALRAGLLPVTPFDPAVYLKRGKRRKRGSGKVRGHKRLVGRSMEERPASVAPGGAFGHWEIDTVPGRRTGGGAAVPALLEKRTRYLMVFPLAARSREAVRAALSGLHEEYASRFGEVFASVTADNGTEFGELGALESWGTRVYFAHPYNSSERGQNERHNALLRRFLPKGTALEHYTADDLCLIADEINRLPRRQLDYRTPDELFENELDNIYEIQHAQLVPTGCSICNCN